MGRHTGVVATGLVLLWLAAGGCGQSFIASNTEAGKDQESDDGASAAQTYTLAPAGATDLDVRVDRSAPLKVYLLEKTSGEPVSGEPIAYDVVDGRQSGSVGSEKSATGEQGEASVPFRAGSTPGEATIEAYHPKAASVQFDVTVRPKPSGRLQIELVNTGRSVMALQDISVRLYETDDLECSRFEPLASERAESLRTKLRESAGRTVEFGALTTDRSYTVTAVARGERGQVAAGGCEEGLQIPTDGVAEKELLLQLVPLNPTGRYYATTYYDFSNALEESGVVGENIIRVLDLFEDPGGAIYEEAINLIENFVGDLVGSAFETFLDQTGLDDQFRGMINDAVQQNETLCKIREIGRDVRDVVANLEIDSELTVGRLGSNYEFSGRDNWLNVTLYWRAKCEGAFEEACSGEEDDGDVEERKRPCAAIHLAPEDDEDEIGDIGVWSSEWEGRLTSYNQLQIERHPLPLRYGKLIQYVLKEVVIPRLTDGNANSLSDAFAYWLGCDSLAGSITGSDGEVCAPDPIDACIEDDQISSACETAVGTVFAAANIALSELEFDTGITVGGEADLVETTSDGRVDYIENGSWDGYIEVSSPGNTDGQSSISGTWSAERTSTEILAD